MKLPPNIKPYPFFWKKIKFLNRIGGDAIYPFIFLRNDIFNDLKSSSPNPLSIALLEHELLHLKRQKEQGPLVFSLKYIFSSRYRIKEELLAYKRQAEILKKYNKEFDKKVIAKNLSSWMYLWAISYNEALKLLS